MLFTFIIVLATISYLYDIYYNKNFKDCYSLSFNGLLYIHHLLAITLLFGFLSNSVTFLKLYIALVTIVYISWFIYKDKCIITVATNRMCGIPDDVPFESIISVIVRKIFKTNNKQKTKTELIIFPILIIIAFIRIKILSKKKKV